MTLLRQTVSWTDLTPNQCAEMWCSHLILQACVNFVRESQKCTTVDEQYNKRTTGTTTDCWNSWRNKGSSHEGCSNHRCVPVPLWKTWRNQRTATIGIKQMRNLWLCVCVCSCVQRLAAGGLWAPLVCVKGESHSLHHGCGDEAAVLYGRERRGEVSRVRGLHHLLVPVHHVQVAVKLFSNLFGQLQKKKKKGKKRNMSVSWGDNFVFLFHFKICSNDAETFYSPQAGRRVS